MFNWIYVPLGIALLITGLIGLLHGANQPAQVKEDRAWVIDTLHPGMAWNEEAVTRRLGDPEITFTSTLGSVLVENYYFPSIDMTIVVKSLTREIVTLR